MVLKKRWESPKQVVSHCFTQKRRCVKKVNNQEWAGVPNAGHCGLSASLSLDQGSRHMLCPRQVDEADHHGEQHHGEVEVSVGALRQAERGRPGAHDRVGEKIASRTYR